jgi:hypothetical protein
MENKLPLLPKKTSIPAEEYFEESRNCIGLLGFILDSVLTGDYMIHIAKNALEENVIDKELDPQKLALKDPGPRTKVIRKFSQQLLESFFIRIVDNFEVYLIQILKCVLKKRPEILSTRQQSISLEDIFQYTKISLLIDEIIEKKINALSFKGFIELEKWYFQKEIPIVVKTEYREKVKEYIATRNIVVHNRAIIDGRYLENVKKSKYKLGDKRKLNPDDLFEALNILNTIVVDTDKEIVKKYNIKKVDLGLMEGSVL